MWIKALAFSLVVLANAGCAYLMPPQKIPMDRRNYIEAVSISWKEQLLTNLVKLRYGDTLTFLEMTSITTGYELGVGATAAYTHRWSTGGSWDFRNLATGGGSVTYLDKPTISYAPMRGEALTKTLIKPIPAMQLLRSYQVGWRPDYIFSCCVKSINDCNNPQNEKFYTLARLFTELRGDGCIRIIVDEAKAPTKYDVTLHLKDKIFPEKDKAGPGDKAAAKAGGKPKKQTKKGMTTDSDKNDKKDKEEDEEPAIALLVLDKKRLKDVDEEWKKKPHPPQEKAPVDKVREFKELLWPQSASTKEQEKRKKLYNDNCSRCHGEPVKPPGTVSISPNPKAVNFNDPHFWAGELDQKIPHAVTSPKEEMKKGNLKLTPTEIRQILVYIKDAFGNFEVYGIIDGNESPPQKDPYCDKIYLRTRSIMQVLIYLSQFIEVPPEHLPDPSNKKDQNRAEERTLREQAVDGPGGIYDFKIEWKKERPSDAFVAVRHSGYWFYIDDKRHKSKDVFSGIAGILSMSEPITKEATPVLTLPVQ